eukprot:jgi/Chrzof1/6989/Cz02g06210.t1
MIDQSSCCVLSVLTRLLFRVEHAAFDDNDSDNDAASVAAGDATTHADELTGGEGAASAGARGAEDPELSFKEEVGAAASQSKQPYITLLCIPSMT